ncbi:MAG: T9SS type A sorting domain-containing protein, partial [Bacteroidetes bacterium]
GERFRLIPNPAQSSVRIDVAEFIGRPITLHIYNQLGALIWSRQYNAVDVDFVTVELDQHGFADGVYQVSLTCENERLIKALVVQRIR